MIKIAMVNGETAKLGYMSLINVCKNFKNTKSYIF